MRIEQLDPIGIEVTGIDLANGIGLDEMFSIVSEVPKHEVVVLRNQHIDAGTFVDWIKPAVTYSQAHHWCAHPQHPEIFRVTNKEIEKGRLGFFGDGELDWHCNSPLMDNHEELVSLYCIEEDPDCLTSFCDVRAAWGDLPEDIKDECRQCTVTLQFQNNYYDFKDYELEAAIESNKQRAGKRSVGRRTVKMVDIHPGTNDEYLYFPFMFYKRIIGAKSDQLLDYLKSFILTDKYIYHHNWKKGDLVLSDQLVGIHKRSGKPQKPRELYRTVSWYKE